MSNFGGQKVGATAQALPHALPSFFADMPVLLILLLFIYHIVASLVIFKFDDSKFNIGLLIFMDLCAGGFMAWFFGVPYFYLTVLLPVLETAFYFGTFISIVVLIISISFFGPLVIMLIIKHLQNSAFKDILMKQLFDLVWAFVFSAAAIYINFIWSLRHEEEVSDIVRKFQEEKRMLFESHQATKKEFGVVFNELEKKQVFIDELESRFQKKEENLIEARQKVDVMSMELEHMEESVTQSERDALEQQKKILTKQNKLLKRKEGETEVFKKRLETEYKDGVNKYQAMIKELESNLGVTEVEYRDIIKDLEGKISLLVGKISELNVALQSRENLFESYTRISQAVDIESTYLAIINEALKLVPSQTAILFVVEDTDMGKHLFADVAATPYKNLFIDYSVSVGEGAVGWAVRNSKALKINRSSIKLKNGNELSTLIRYEKSALIVPVQYAGEVTGAMYLGKPEEAGFSDKDVYLMKSFCKLAGSLIHLAVQLEKTMQVSLIDETTGLYNDIYFNERFREEVARALRYEIPLTFVMMEIINYEQFAERAGQLVQDRLVQDLTGILQSHVRETDLAARLTENQFAILFIHSSKIDTIHIAERIRMGAEMRSFGSPQARASKLHLCLGLANISEDAESSEELYNLTLKSLEDAKGKGGSQTCFLT
ncbi:MAG: diguanylate cyclase [Candidatus Eremiobacteraeota bacterium]|nr:diguanylate cyclase [Candidatus Eremiobacteraeota bacterium]